MILYRFRIRNLYHLLLVVRVWLLKKLRISEISCGIQRSATIVSSPYSFSCMIRIHMISIIGLGLVQPVTEYDMYVHTKIFIDVFL